MANPLWRGGCSFCNSNIAYLGIKINRVAAIFLSFIATLQRFVNCFLLSITDFIAYYANKDAILNKRRPYFLLKYPLWYK